MGIASTLFIYALSIAVVGPRLISRSTWLAQSPRLALMAWQSLSASLLLSSILATAVVAFPAGGFADGVADLLHTCLVVLRLQYGAVTESAWSAVAFMLSIAMFLRTTYGILSVAIPTVRQRRSQLRALALLAQPGTEDDVGGALILDHQQAMAYCLPGRKGTVIITSAALQVLGPNELDAVLAHEHAHLRGRHHLLVGFSAALTRAFPWVPALRLAHQQTQDLIELIADDAAVRRHSSTHLAHAVVRLAEAQAPKAALGIGGRLALARVHRLQSVRRPLRGHQRLALLLIMFAVLATPAAVILQPALAATATDHCILTAGGTAA